MSRSRFSFALLAGLVILGLVPGAASAKASDARVGNLVWEDLDGDGRQDYGEPGLAGVTVELLDAGGSVVATRLTSATGRWGFRVDASVDWRVQVTAPGGRSFSPRNAFWNDAKDSDANARGLISIPAGSLTAGVVDRSFDAGVVPAVLFTQIGNRVWADVDEDGRQESGEPGMEGVTVELLDAGGSVAATRTTNRNGVWGFVVDAGLAWQVRITAPEGRRFTTQDAVPNDARDSDADGDGLIEIGVGTLTAGETDKDFDAGLIRIPVAPLFEGNAGGVTLAIDVAENQTAVTDLGATDADGDHENGGGLTYSLTPCCEGDDNALFSLDADSGVLTFLTAPDFENPTDEDTDGNYLVQAMVTDSDGLFDVQDITITVTDVVESLEIISDGGGATAAVEVAENQTAVTDVDAAGPNGDTENGGGLTYSLTGGDGCVDLLRCDVRALPAAGADNGLFSLDADSGVLTFRSAPDFEVPGDSNGDNDYQVQVTVTDSDANTDTQDITITVTDVNEAPEITSNGGGVTASVGVAEGQTAVTDVEATDPEGEVEGGGLTYSLTTDTGGGVDNGLFFLDEGSGVLWFLAAPDFGDPDDFNSDNDYLVAVKVTDSQGLADYQSFTVTVTEVVTGTIVIQAESDASETDLPFGTADLRITPTGTALSFTQDIDTAGGFMLNPVAGPNNPDTKTFSDVSAGTYVVVASLPATLGWFEGILSCVDSSVEGIDSTVVASYASSTATATINLDPGETVTCTWFYSAFPA